MLLFSSFIFIGVVKLKTLSIETKKKNRNIFFKVLNIKMKKQIIKKKKTKIVFLKVLNINIKKQIIKKKLRKIGKKQVNFN